MTILVLICCYWWIVSYIASISFSLCLATHFLGAGDEFLVQLRQHDRYNIYIGYYSTATNWISGTRSYGKYFSMHSKDSYFLFFSLKQCTLAMANVRIFSNSTLANCRCLETRAIVLKFFLLAHFSQPSARIQNVLETNLVVKCGGRLEI